MKEKKKNLDKQKLFQSLDEKQAAVVDRLKLSVSNIEFDTLVTESDEDEDVSIEDDDERNLET